MHEAVNMHIYFTFRVDQLEATAGDDLMEGVQPDPAWVAAHRQAMRVHVSLVCCCWHLVVCLLGVHNGPLQVAAVIASINAADNSATSCFAC